MSYEGLFIAKGGVTLDIPLYDSSTTLMTLNLLYDIYIQLLTLDLHLTWLNITMHMYSCETTWLEQALQDIIDTRSTVVRPTLWYACYGEAGEMFPSLVICDVVHASHGDILLKRTLASVATSALVQPLLPTRLLTCAWSSWVRLNWKHTDAKFLCWSSSVCWWSCISTRRSACSTPVGLASCLHIFECVEWVRLHVCAQRYACCWILCMKSTTLLTMFALCQLLGWILNLYWQSFIHECMLLPLLFMFLLQLIRLSM